MADFKQKLMALLDIPAERIRIVGISRGSTVVKAVILSKKKVEEERSEKEAVKQEFQSFLQKFESAVQNDEIDFGAPVLEVKNEMAIDDVEPEAEEGDPDAAEPDSPEEPAPVDPSLEADSPNTTRNILLGVLIPVGVIALAVSAFFVYKCCGKKEAPAKMDSRTKFNHTKDMTSSRSNNPAHFVINNNERKKFGGANNPKITKQIALRDPTQIESYINRRN